MDRLDDLDVVMSADGGDGTATIKLAAKDMKVVAKMGEPTLSGPASDPTTGADIGAGPEAGRTKHGDMGGAANINEAPAQAEAAVRRKTSKAKSR